MKWRNTYRSIIAGAKVELVQSSISFMELLLFSVCSDTLGYSTKPQLTPCTSAVSCTDANKPIYNQSLSAETEVCIIHFLM